MDWRVRRGQEQLGWVQKNRAPRRPRRTRFGGDLVREMIHDLDRAGGADQQKLAAAIGAVVDEPFRSCCRIGPVERGVLRIVVEDPSLTYAMRMQWQGRLAEMLRERKGGIAQVSFVTGTYGTPVPGPVVAGYGRDKQAT